MIFFSVIWRLSSSGTYKITLHFCPKFSKSGPLAFCSYTCTTASDYTTTTYNQYYIKFSSLSYQNLAAHSYLSLWILYCKVALATLHTELMRIQDGGYIAVDPTSLKLSMPYQSFTVWYVHGTVNEGYAHARRPVDLPESAVTSGKFQNGI